MKFILLSIALFTFLFATGQQGNNFSMWFKNNLTHNPASVGTNSNDLKLFTNFRYQYFSVTDKPFQTISASVSGRVLESDKRYSHPGIGASFVNDVSGDGRYSVTEFSVPIAYHIYFNEKTSISLGLNPGIYQYSIGNSDLNWGHQWNGFEFNQSVPGEAEYNRTETTFKINPGIFFKHQTSHSNKFYFGFSVKHINKPDISFKVPDNMHIRYIGQFGMSHRFRDSHFGISPQMLAVVQGPNRNIVFGSNFDYYLQDPSRSTIFYMPTIFSFGIYHRYEEAIIVNAQYSFKAITIAVSYDSNINSLLPTTKSVGGFEVALSYDLMFNRKGRFIY